MSNFREMFSNIERRCELANQEFEKQKALLTSSPLILFGAGAVGNAVASCLIRRGIDFECFADSKKEGIHALTGKRIISKSRLIDSYKDANIIICSVNYYNEIAATLKSSGYSSQQIFEGKFLNLHKCSYEDLKFHLDGYEWAYNFFQDALSREIILGRIECYLSDSPVIVAPLKSSPLGSQYFEPDVIKLSDGEVFVDGGMYDGYTTEEFIKIVKGKYKHCYGFEPDKDNYQTATERLRKYSETTVVQKGLWNSERRLGFSGGETSGSRLDEASVETYVEVVSLDAFFADKQLPTFIKMDIEGAEKDALMGADSIIRENKPKLAISAYHKLDDIYILPQHIHKTNPQYSLTLRHYTNSLYETVLYATMQ